MVCIVSVLEYNRSCKFVDMATIRCQIIYVIILKSIRIRVARYVMHESLTITMANVRENWLLAYLSMKLDSYFL